MYPPPWYQHVVSKRFLASRLSLIPPDFPNRVGRRPFLNIPMLLAAFGAGVFLSYNETIFDQYGYATQASENPMLRVALNHKIRSLPLFQEIVYSNRSPWTRVRVPTLGHGLNGGDGINTSLLFNQLSKSVNGLVVNEDIFYDKSSKRSVLFAHVGFGLCGYPFIVHGGIIGTLLKELFKIYSCLNFNELTNSQPQYKITSMTIKYCQPTFANQRLTIETSVFDEDSSGAGTKMIKSCVFSESRDILVESIASLSNT